MVAVQESLEYWRSPDIPTFHSQGDYLSSRHTKRPYLLEGRIFLLSSGTFNPGHGGHAGDTLEICLAYPDGSRSGSYPVLLRAGDDRASQIVQVLKSASGEGIDGLVGGVYHSTGFSVHYLKASGLEAAILGGWVKDFYLDPAK